MSSTVETSSSLLGLQQQHGHDDVLLGEDDGRDGASFSQQQHDRNNNSNHHHDIDVDTVSLDRGMSQLDAMSSSFPTATAQTRFSFYDAEQVNGTSSSSSSLHFTTTSSLKQQHQQQRQQDQDSCIHEEKKLPQESPTQSSVQQGATKGLPNSRSNDGDDASSKKDSMKRFSFYNAEEVKLEVTTTTSTTTTAKTAPTRATSKKKAAATPPHINTDHVDTTTTSSNNNAHKKNRKHHKSKRAAMRASREPSLFLPPPPDQPTPCSVATGASADSFEILKSLQETERQRGLWGQHTTTTTKLNSSSSNKKKKDSRRLVSSSNANTPRGGGGGEVSVSSEPGSVSSAPATVFSAASSGGGFYAVRHDGGDDKEDDEEEQHGNTTHEEEEEEEDSSNSNPYHHAILEALQLLRSKKSSSTTNSALLEAASQPSQEQQEEQDRDDDDAGDHHSVHSAALTDLIESKRREWDRNHDDANLNEDEQQQQQQEGNGIGTTNLSSSLLRPSQDAGVLEEGITTAGSNSQQQNQPFALHRKDRSDSMAESSLGMSSAEDVVQRSVERVLLAILERASTSRTRGGAGTPNLKSSSSRPSAGAEDDGDDDDDDEDGVTAQSGTSAASTNEDSLLQAMHELFPSTATASAMAKSSTYTPFPVTSISSGTSRSLEVDHQVGLVLSPMVSTTAAPPLLGNDQVSPKSNPSSPLFPPKSVVEELLGEVEMDSESAALEHFLSLGTSSSSKNAKEDNAENGPETSHLALDSLRLKARQQQQLREKMTSPADQELEDFERELEDEIADIEREMRDIDRTHDGDPREDSGLVAIAAVALPGIYHYDDDENDDGPNTLDSLVDVLGPLCQGSEGGTTGVVLEHSPQSRSTKRSIPPPPSLPPPPISTGMHSPGSSSTMAKRSPPSIFDSLSSAMKDAENLVNLVAQAISPERSPPQGHKELKDKYSALMSDDEECETPDNEAHELMKTLCAHLMPPGLDNRKRQLALSAAAAAAAGSPKGLDAVPAWDESNPNEPGYRIIRLTKQQLRRVEREFARTIQVLQSRSERLAARHKVVSDWNGVLKDMEDDDDDEEDDDSNFQRDLEEAEAILNREEKRMDKADQQRDKPASSRRNNVKLAASRESKDDGESSETDFDSTDDNDDTEVDESITPREGVEGHPDFPGIRPSGKGEMGDLEYFHLPIIYKSHVTGFEPTKDLFLEPGNVVAGQYLVENELGSAAFSTTYRCIDLNSGNGEYHEEVCLKVIKNTKDFFDQSLDEIKILELLRQTGQCHDNHIIEMRTFFYHREHLVIVTELLRQNLFEFGKFILDNDEEPYFTLTRLAYITRQVLIALNFVHKLGLVHSDVKPENILLGSYSRAQVKLIDFGSSCYLTDRQSSYIQSRSYRAPEVVLGLPYDGKIDIWSLGCVVAEMFTGEVTFQNDSIVSMLCRIEAICGAFPRHMVGQGRQSNRFFTKSGLLYEAVDASEGDAPSGKEGSGSLDLDDEDDSQRLERFDVFQPKVTTLAARLGFVANLMDLSNPTEEEKEQALFVDFCRCLLTIDPDRRPSAAQALEHPWIVAAGTLTEEDIKYPTQ